MWDAYLQCSSEQTKVKKKKTAKEASRIRKDGLLEECDDVPDKETKGYHRKCY